MRASTSEPAGWQRERKESRQEAHEASAQEDDERRIEAHRGKIQADDGESEGHEDYRESNYTNLLST